MPAGLLSGSDGCASTGASTDGSSIIDSAKLPVKHMPIAPTPGPPHSRCANAASARSHCVAGELSLAWKARNWRLMQPPIIVKTIRGARGTAPSFPKICGI